MKATEGEFDFINGRSWSRRSALRIAAMAAGSPFLAQLPLAAQSPRPPRTYPPTYGNDVMAPVNVNEMEEVARQKVAPEAYDYIAGGSGGEMTLRANQEAFLHVQLRRRVGIDVSQIDTSLELLGKKLDFPILLGPGGHKNLVYADGERVAAQGAGHSKALYMTGPSDWMSKMQASQEAPVWWASSLGFSEKAAAQAFAKRAEDGGASAISITVDYTYTAPRDREVRNKFDFAWSNNEDGVPPNPNASSAREEPAVAGMIWPFVTGMTWSVLDWMHAVTKLPIVVKGIVTAEDARSAVEHGAQAIIVSNHGGRTLDGMLPTLYALPEVAMAVNNRVPVLMDGGIRRGPDIVKAMSLGAKAVLIGRPYYWGLAAFGQEGVQRVIEMLHGEMMNAMGNAGIPNLASFDRSLVEFLPGTRSVLEGEPTKYAG
jgi:isopentenyl diphosphate isomerase/L-lactate dehydrogenase-like FMN-dependent dehydrogenase